MQRVRGSGGVRRFAEMLQLIAQRHFHHVALRSDYFMFPPNPPAVRDVSFADAPRVKEVTVKVETTAGGLAVTRRWWSRLRPMSAQSGQVRGLLQE